MGYEIHIVRRNDWDNYEEDSNILLDEWLAYVHEDNELELTNGYLIKIPGAGNTFQNVPGFCNWNGHPTKVRDDKPWFDYGYGRISAKYPDDETIKKMIAIADRLNAQVQGDDGEFYNEEYFSKKAGLSSGTTNNGDKKPWWKLW